LPGFFHFQVPSRGGCSQLPGTSADASKLL
jgi:hypothetical protein